MLIYEFFRELFVGVFGYFADLLSGIVGGALGGLFGISKA